MQLAPAFENPVLASQAVFRATMNAMARPGLHTRLPRVAAPSPFCAAAAAVALALVDYETPVWLDAAFAADPAASEWLRFHTGAAIVSDPKLAAFAFIADARNAPPFAQFATGTLEYPDRSTTLLLQVDRFDAAEAMVLTGPGIPDRQPILASPLPADFLARLVANHERFPRGVDLLLACDDQLVAIPRSARVIDGRN